MNPSPWTPEDLEQMKALGIDPAEATRQLELFRNPPPALALDRPAIAGDGIRKMDEARKAEALRKYEEARGKGRFMKFVPASGAASRMFQLPMKYLQRPSRARNELEQEAMAGDKDSRQILDLMKSLGQTAFYGDLEALFAKRGKNLKTVLTEGGYRIILEALLNEDGLGYAHKPKGLIKFHSYPSEKRTAFEEHLLEVVRYAQDGSKTSRIHFTVSDDHLAEYRDFLGSVKDGFEQKHGVRLAVDFSIQESRTNTLAVGLNNEPFRDGEGRLVFRPSGHGALLGNLNDLPGDLIYVKNIDNVSVESWLETTVQWKKMLGGVLTSAQERIFHHLGQLDPKKTGPDDLKAIEDFAREELGIIPGGDFNGMGNVQKVETLQHLLNRPVRVCGVVPNTGEPGGGPFWVKGFGGRSTLQIVESAQIDQTRPDQKEIMQKSTHFNPVDLVCGVRDWKGNPFGLARYSDPNAVFISRKAHAGKELKALELPGLWNGAMADWITLFVEVPLETFNPVKTVFDLLRPAHQV